MHFRDPWGFPLKRPSKGTNEKAFFSDDLRDFFKGIPILFVKAGLNERRSHILHIFPKIAMF